MLTSAQTPAIITSPVTLRFDPPADSEIQVVTSKQLDSLMRIITVKLTKGGGIFQKPQNAQIKLRGTKPDGTAFDLLPQDSDEGKGIYSFALTKNILSVSGDISCDAVCSILADETYICSTEVFVIRNLAAAVEINAEYSENDFQTIEEAVYRAYTAADNANSAATAVLNVANDALAVIEGASTASQNANQSAADAISAANIAVNAAETASAAANSATKAANTALAAAENCPTELDLKDFAIIKSRWINPDYSQSFGPQTVTVGDGTEENVLFYVIKYRAKTTLAEYDTGFLFAVEGDKIVKINSSVGVNRQAVYSVENGVPQIVFSSDAANETFYIPCEILSVSVKG